MSALTEQVMDPEKDGAERQGSEELPSSSEPESEEGYWQWVALVVLLACWLAEASF